MRGHRTLCVCEYWTILLMYCVVLLILLAGAGDDGVFFFCLYFVGSRFFPFRKYMPWYLVYNFMCRDIMRAGAHPERPGDPQRELGHRSSDGLRRRERHQHLARVLRQDRAACRHRSNVRGRDKYTNFEMSRVYSSVQQRLWQGGCAIRRLLTGRVL